MDMAVLQFYKNKYQYPKYSETLTAYGSPMDCTPVGVNLRTGKIRAKGTFSDFMSCNYLALTRSGRTIYAWIDDVTFINEEVFEVAYTVDAWRTYKGSIDLGTQFIVRSPQETSLLDKLLGSTQPYMDITSTLYELPNHDKRTLVIQLRADSAEAISNAPVQPTPYQFYLTNFNINSWQDNAAMSQLMHSIGNAAQTTNLVTMYSIPYMDISGLGAQDLVLKYDSGDPTTISGFKMIGSDNDVSGLLYVETELVFTGVDDLLKVDHTIQVVIPEAGIIPIPDEILKANKKIYLRQDIDLFSGASNYMLCTTDEFGLDKKYYQNSVRGSSVSSIPIISNPEDTYISQNQNALTTSLIGDVANVALGVGIMRMGGFMNPAAAAGMMRTDPSMLAWGGSVIAQGGTGMLNTWAQTADGGTNWANPPAFLGTALASNFNQKFWVIVRKTHVTNADKVNDNYGYPYNMVDTLSFPSNGYIETEHCHVASTDGSVPRWALNEINTLFDNGILVK